MSSTHNFSKNELLGISAVFLKSPQIVGVIMMTRKILKQIDKGHLGTVKSNMTGRESICRTHINSDINELVSICVIYHMVISHRTNKQVKFHGTKLKCYVWC